MGDSKTKKIAHLLASNFYGGPEKQIVEQLKNLDKNLFEPLVISFDEKGTSNDLLNRAKADGIQSIGLSSPGVFSLKPVKELIYLIKSEGIDLLCVHGYKANVTGLFASFFTRCPVLAVSRGWTAEDYKIRIYEGIDKIFLRFVDHVVAVSEGQKTKLGKLGISSHKMSVIHNSINMYDSIDVPKVGIRKDLGIPEDSLIVASAGRLSPEKNYSGMIQVAVQVVQDCTNVYFVVFGEGTLRPSLEAKILDKKLSRHFFLPGFRDDIPSVMQEIDIFMLPSFTEGLPNVVLEAFAAAKPVIASAVGGTPEVVEDGISGFLFAPDDVVGMSSKVTSLVDSKNLRIKMGRAGQKRVCNHFTFEEQTAAYANLYRRLLE